MCYRYTFTSAYFYKVNQTANVNKILKSKILEILYRLGVKVDNISLIIGLTLYFIGKYT